jgi:FkbM family methyltransferase
VALDIGANMGLFTAMMARRVKYGVTGYVHALEPCPAAHADLCRVLQANGIDNVHAPMYAISDRCGRAAFMTIDEGSVAREASCLADLGRQGVLPGTAKGQIEVETITLDKYLADHSMRPKLIKIDVEGAEFLVLEGGREFIRDAHPLLVIEIHEDASGAFDHGRLRRYLDEYGYRYQNRHKIYFCE